MYTSLSDEENEDHSELQAVLLEIETYNPKKLTYK